MMEKKVIIRNNIRELRKKLNITQEELAEHLGKSKSYISKIEKDHVPPFELSFLIVDAIKDIYLNKTNQLLELDIGKVFWADISIQRRDDKS